MDDTSLPVVDVEPRSDAAGSTTVWGVVLASGSSDRFGERNKLLEPVDGVPLVRRATRPLTAAAIDGVTVIVGYEADDVAAVFDDFDVTVRRNQAYHRGQSTSVREGVRAAIEHDADAVVFALGDMPAVSPSSCARLVAAYDRGVGNALAAGYRGQRGNPVLFGSTYFDELRSLERDTGGRDILRSAPDGAIVETGDPGVRFDVDTTADLAALDDRSGDRLDVDSRPRNADR